MFALVISLFSSLLSVATISGSTEDFWEYYYSPAATSTRKTMTVSKKRPMIVVRRFLRCLRVYEMWLGVAGWRDNSHMHLLLEYKVYKPVSILLSHFIGWQTTTSRAAGNNRLYTSWKIDLGPPRSSSELLTGLVEKRESLTLHDWVTFWWSLKLSNGPYISNSIAYSTAQSSSLGVINSEACQKRNTTVYSHNAGQVVHAAVANRMFLLSNTPSKVLEVGPTAEGALLITTTVGETSKFIREFWVAAMHPKICLWYPKEQGQGTGTARPI